MFENQLLKFLNVINFTNSTTKNDDKIHLIFGRHSYFFDTDSNREYGSANAFFAITYVKRFTRQAHRKT